MGVVEQQKGNIMRALIVAPLLSLLLVVSCSEPKPQDIAYGEQSCTNCMMAIEDQQFGAEAVANTGKVYQFDAIECMLGWYLEETDVKQADVHSLWVTDFSQPGMLIDARTAHFAQSDDVRSPMSLNVASFASSDDRDAALRRLEGASVPTFEDLLTYAEDYR